MATLVDDLVPDQLWAIVEPLLPVPPRPPYGGRHRAIPDRNCFAAIVYMAPHLHSLAAAAGTRAWLRLVGDLLAPPDRVGQRRRVRSAAPGVWDRLGEHGRLDWSRASVDTMSVRAKRGGTI